MKCIKHITLLLISISLLACTPRGGTNSENLPSGTSINVDSLREEFLSGWNTRDSAAIMHTISANAVVMNDSLVHRGHEAIGKNWISGGVKVLSNIQTTSLIRESCEDIAYDGGTYTLDLTLPNGIVLKERGNYSLVWARQAGGEWKLTLVHIEDITRLPDVR